MSLGHSISLLLLAGAFAWGGTVTVFAGEVGFAEAAEAATLSYHHQTWTPDDGLPDNAVDCLLQTRDGWLWIGTRSGLARFDGVQFTVFDGRTPGFTDDAILALAEDLSGNLWIATKKGLYRKQGGVFTKFTTAEGLVHDHVAGLHLARDGTLWVATHGGLNRFKDGVFKGWPLTETVDNHAGGLETYHQILTVTDNSEGNLWVGTLWGLKQLDLATGGYLPVWSSPVLRSGTFQAPVQVVFADRDGRLWFGTDDMLARREGDGWREYRFEADGGDIRLRRIVQTANGTIWVVRAGKLFRVQGDTLTREDERLGLADSYVTDVLFDRQGILWVGTRFHGLHCLQAAALRVFTTRDGLCHNGVVSVTPSRDGGLWVGTVHGLMRLRDATFAFPQADVPARDLVCRVVFEESNGDLWLGTAPGPGGHIYCLERGPTGYRRLAAPNTAQEHAALFEDGHQRLWVGGRTGLACLLPDAVANLQGREMHPPDETLHRANRWVFEPTRVVMQARPAPVEFATNLWRYVSGGVPGWRPLSTAPAEYLADAPIRLDQHLSSYDVRAILEDRRGDLWFGTWGGGLNRLRDRRIDVFTARDGLAGDHVQALHEDAEGVLGVGTTRGLSRIVDRSSRRESALDSQNGEVVRLTPAPGLQRRPELSGQRPNPQPVGQASGLPVPGVSDANRLGSASAGSVEMAGVNSVNRPRFFSFTTAHGLPDNRVNQILEDDAGHLWIGCDEGIYRVAKRELAEVAAGCASRVECLLLDEQDGLLGGQTYSGSQPSACKTPEGRLWFATPHGLAMLDPAHVSRHDARPKVFLERLRVGNVWLDLLDESSGAIRGARSSGREFAHFSLQRSQSRLTSAATIQGSKVQLSAGSGRSLEFEFTGLEYFAPKKLRFRYRLEGFDRDWVEAGVRHTAFYTNLKPGAYRFQVKATDRQGRQNTVGASLALYLAPHVYETAWFKVGGWFVGSVVLCGLVYWRLRDLRRRNELARRAALAEQRIRIADDLHDELGANLSRLARLCPPHSVLPEPSRFEQLSASLRAALASLDQTVWLLQPKNDTLPNFADYLQRFADGYFEGAPLRRRWIIASDLPAAPLSAQARHDLFLICQEALANVLKHAQAREVRLELGVTNGRLQITIADDGCGFDGNGAHESRNGLGSMERRARRLGGRLSIESHLGLGTKVSPELPMNDSPLEGQGAPQ